MDRLKDNRNYLGLNKGKWAVTSCMIAIIIISNFNNLGGAITASIYQVLLILGLYSFRENYRNALIYNLLAQIVLYTDGLLKGKNDLSQATLIIIQVVVVVLVVTYYNKKDKKPSMVGLNKYQLIILASLVFTTTLSLAASLRISKSAVLYVMLIPIVKFITTVLYLKEYYYVIMLEGIVTAYIVIISMQTSYQTNTLLATSVIITTVALNEYMKVYRENTVSKKNKAVTNK